jgi:hypothetical protein
LEAQGFLEAQGLLEAQGFLEAQGLVWAIVLLGIAEVLTVVAVTSDTVTTILLRHKLSQNAGLRIFNLQNLWFIYEC